MGKRLWLIGILLCPLIPLVGQDIDANPSLEKRSLSTIADQITDPSERAAFVELFAQAPPTEMRTRAAAFLARFPQSAFLAQAYEVAARASFDLESYQPGLDYAEKSLALLPENPLLLVAVADVEAREGRNPRAIVHAQEALDDLDRFGSPASVPEKDWPDLERKLKASADFSQGRALLQQALPLPAGEKRAPLLKDSEASLLAAQRLNSADLEITYLLGLAQFAAGESAEAANNFAATYGAGGELAPQALDNLRTIYQMLYPGAALPFETFLQQAEARARTGRATPANASANTSANTPPGVHSIAEYSGSESCRGCHAAIYQRWSETGMAKMFRPYAPQNVVGDFKTNNRFYLGDEVESQGGKIQVRDAGNRTLFARMLARNGRHYFEIWQSDGNWHTYPVDYTIGSKFQQAYATKLPNGEIHVFPIQYNLLEKRWINYWKMIDGPGSERANPRSWEKLDSATSYQAICAVCHTSQLRNVKGEGFATNGPEFKEPGIDCEMCHGPSTEHVVETSAQQFDAEQSYSKAPLDPPVNFHDAGSRKFVAICAQCHMQSAIRKPGAGGELNYSSSGDFFNNHARLPFGEFSRKGFYKDGRFRQTTFIVEALERSACFKQGQVSCGTCHDPHGHDSASNPTSVKFRDKPDLMCTGCHSQFGDALRASQHSHHPAESEASRCVSCHMPRIMDALLFRARTHQIDDLPNAEMTERFGQEESPNACLLCHRQKDAEWVEQQLRAWRPESGRPKTEISLDRGGVSRLK
jgi:doubled CXXCH motif protein/cytochrome c554/c'-like protein